MIVHKPASCIDVIHQTFLCQLLFNAINVENDVKSCMYFVKNTKHFIPVEKYT